MRSSSCGCSGRRGRREPARSRRPSRRLSTARLDTLTPELKALLQDASVVGKVFWTGAVAAMGGRERDDVRQDLKSSLAESSSARSGSRRWRARRSSRSGTPSYAMWRTSRSRAGSRAEKHVEAAEWIGTAARPARRPGRDPRAPLRRGARARRAAGGRPTWTGRGETRAVLLLAGDRAMGLDIPAAEATTGARWQRIDSTGSSARACS